MKNVIVTLLILTTIKIFAQPAGSLDPTFGNGGKVVTSISTGQDKAYGVALQSNGKILVVGHSSSSVTGKDFVAIRYNTNGTLDSAFGNNGIVTTDLQLGSDDIAYSVAIQSDGKIVLAGYSDNGSNKDAALVRYNPNGVIDSTFGNNGIVITNFENSQQDEIKVVKIHQLTGKIVVGGATIISSSLSKPVVARYLSNGTLDTSFNHTGIRLLWITSLDYQYLYSVEDLVVQSNGKISAVGWRDFPGIQWDADYWACRINSDGTMDNTFSSDGVNVYNGGFNGNDKAYAMLLKPNNNILMAGGGFLSALKYDFTLIELNSNGTTGTYSAMADWGSSLDDIVYGLAEDNNGKFVLTGSSGTSTNKTFAIARVNTTATLDNSFGTNGKITTTFGNNTLNECFDMAIQTDNKIVAIGYTGSDFAIARYLGDATPDLNNIQLLTPANQSTNQNFSNLLFDWSDAFGAVNYEIEIDISQTFNSSPITITISSSNYNATNLLPNTQYYWRVRATDGTNWGSYTNVRSFTTNSLNNFNLISPANNSVNQIYLSSILDWSDNIGASTYELQIDTTQNFSTSPQTFTTANSTYVTNLLPSKTYYWRVRASSGTTWGQYTNTWNFKTKNDPTSICETYFSNLKIYPNPTTDFVTLETNINLISKPYKIFDNLGKEIFSGIIDTEQKIINFNKLSKGIYFLQIGDYPQQTYKLIKE